MHGWLVKLLPDFLIVPRRVALLRFTKTFSHGSEYLEQAGAWAELYDPEFLKVSFFPSAGGKRSLVGLPFLLFSVSLVQMLPNSY